MALFPIKYRPFFLILFVLFLAFLFFLNNLKDLSKFGCIEQTVFSVGTQLQKATNSFVSVPVNVWKRYCCLLGVERKNALLVREIKALRQENNLLRESFLSTQRLRELLNFKDRLSFKTVASEVVGVDASLFFKTVFIDKGEKERIKKDLAVINEDGVVGKVLRVVDYSSVILLLPDKNFAVDALVQKTRSRGVVAGAGAGLCEMKYVPQSETVETGGLVVTSGLEGVFPKGVPIGRIISANKSGCSSFQEIAIKPVVDFGKLEEVLVVLDY